jgi:hypothetical protein
LKTKPKPGRGRKKLDPTKKPNELHGATTGEKVVAAYEGRFAPTPTTLAELLAGFIELGTRLPKRPLPGLANVHALAIQQASNAELPVRIEAVGRDLAITLSHVDLGGIPALLRGVADVIESRPLQRHRSTGPIVLAPADPTTAACSSLLGVISLPLLKEGRQNIDGDELIAHLRAMPPKKRLDELRKLGATGDDRTVKRKLTALFGELRLAPGRPRKPDK